MSLYYMIYEPCFGIPNDIYNKCDYDGDGNKDDGVCWNQECVEDVCLNKVEGESCINYDDTSGTCQYKSNGGGDKLICETLCSTIGYHMDVHSCYYKGSGFEGSGTCFDDECVENECYGEENEGDSCVREFRYENEQGECYYFPFVDDPDYNYCRTTTCGLGSKYNECDYDGDGNEDDGFCWDVKCVYNNCIGKNEGESCIIKYGEHGVNKVEGICQSGKCRYQYEEEG